MKLQARNFVVRKPETIDITMFFKKFCIATRTKISRQFYNCRDIFVSILYFVAQKGKKYPRHRVSPEPGGGIFRKMRWTEWQIREADLSPY